MYGNGHRGNWYFRVDNHDCRCVNGDGRCHIDTRCVPFWFDPKPGPECLAAPYKSRLGRAFAGLSLCLSVFFSPELRLTPNAACTRLNGKTCIAQWSSTACASGTRLVSLELGHTPSPSMSVQMVTPTQGGARTIASLFAKFQCR